jgi:3-(3-hydroxy-phenyl)propionate hydroxylase
MSRLGVAPNTLVLVRPDEYIAAIVPMDGTPDQAAALYERIVGLPPVMEKLL